MFGYRSSRVLYCLRSLCSRVQRDSHFYSLQFINYFWAQLLACNDNIPNLLNHILKVLERFHLIPMQQMIISLLLMMNIQTFLFIFFSNSLSIKPVLNMHIHKRLFKKKKNIMWIANTISQGFLYTSGSLSTK